MRRRKLHDSVAFFGETSRIPTGSRLHPSGRLDDVTDPIYLIAWIMVMILDPTRTRSGRAHPGLPRCLTGSPFPGSIDRGVSVPLSARVESGLFGNRDAAHRPSGARQEAGFRARGKSSDARPDA